MSIFVAQHHATALDPTCETFVEPGTFCWNSVLVDEHLQYRRYKCLGHSVGSELSGVPEQQVITYADTSVGLVREQSEALFLQLKQVVSEVPISGEPSGIAMRFRDA